MYEFVLKEKPTLLVWNYFELQVRVDVKPINSEQLSVVSRAADVSVLAKRGNMLNLLMHLRRHYPEAVCRTDRSTGEVLSKYRDSYLYRDIL